MPSSADVTNGVLHGYILGTLLFVMFMNDLLEYLKEHA